jgi:hypothetical protein
MGKPAGAFTWRLMALAALSSVCAIAVSSMDRAGWLPGAVRPVAALIPIVPLVAFFVGIARWLGRLDELQRMIHLEAMVIQFSATGILVMSYGMLARVGAVPNLTATQVYPILWIALFVFWSVGLVMVRRKYQ